MIRLGHQNVHIVADQLGGRVCEQSLRGRIERLNDPLLVDRDDGVDGGVEISLACGLRFPTALARTTEPSSTT